MCGLVGIAGSLSTKDVDVFKQLLYIDYLRGEHSTGVGCVHETSGEVRVRKAATDPLMFLQMKSVGEVVNSLNKVLMGHNRFATRGKINAVNAHPYWTGRILGAHNGTLDHICLKDLAKNQEAETDSEQIMLSVHELDGSITETIALMEGAWALSIYDEADNSINLVRNEKRPLYYCMSESKKTLYWASESWMLAGVLDRNGIKRRPIVLLEPDRILSWVIPNSREVFREEPTITVAEGKQRVNFPSPAHNEAPWMDWGQGVRPNTSTNANASNSASKPEQKSNVVELLDDTAKWEIFGAGWVAFSEGKTMLDTPYMYSKNPKSWQAWRDGWLDASQAGEKVDKPKSDVTILDVHRNVRANASKRSNLLDRRAGPGNKRLSRREFSDLTKNECGWCNDPVTFEDKGYFVRTPAHGDIYVGECCTTAQDLPLDHKKEA